ncbi:F-box and WD-40 domain-containing protein CDC4 [Cryptococcus deuterogattii LA55]|nr:F-box and WD-40 domain-containing protein CDC4 [Cryptococcus deuterogattii LA55]KIR72725.1 F-box and WD-40 domain-containing protein CDC4 [Cryptococcus deuterogattii CA1014]KIR95094.1 F-box and WD-40 domain-containing protein CDC4 [Cryptococcus deuterogattii CBS 10090]
MDYNDLDSTNSRRLPTGGLTWTSEGPVLQMEDAVVETVVTHTTRTTTSFQPITLPRVPSPEYLNLPDHLSTEKYPLANQPAPSDMRLFTMTLGGRRVIVQDESAPGESGIEMSGPGWKRTLLNGSKTEVEHGAEVADESLNFLQALNRSKGKEKKREYEERGDAPASPIINNISARRSPPRKKIRGLDEINIPTGVNRALLSPLPSPEHESTPLSSTAAPAQAPNMGSGTELSALFSLPSLVSHFDALPDRLQQHLLMHLLRRSRMPTLQRISSFVSTALRRDFITQLPHEVAIQILKSVDGKSLANASRVCKKWKRIIDMERSVWKARLLCDKLWCGFGTEEQEESLVVERYQALDLRDQLEGRHTNYQVVSGEDEQMFSPTSGHDLPERPTPLKHVYRRRYQDQKNWIHTRPEHSSFTGHGTNVVTCLQFDEDKIVSASDDHSINIYNTSDGQLRKRLDGHEGGVWTLQYKGHTLVSGSTDRTVRIWDLEDLRMTYVFAGHTSTVRCLEIVEPVWEEETQSYQPPVPMIVTGSRDATLRVWKLPQKDDPLYDGIAEEEQTELIGPDINPFHMHLLEGHSLAVRAIATHGRILYSIVYDPYRKRCASGSLDNTIKVWDIVSGQCLHTLQGHTSLVGLLGLSPNYLVSAAADTSLRIWDPNSCQLKNVLASHSGAITCFQHDETKVVSGSDGTLKLWDVKTGTFVRDLVVGISSVWQVSFHKNLLVAASNRNGATVFDVFRFGQPSAQDVDDSSLDNLQPPRWERWAAEKRRRLEMEEKKKRKSRGHKARTESAWDDRLEKVRDPSMTSGKAVLPYALTGQLGYPVEGKELHEGAGLQPPPAFGFKAGSQAGSSEGSAQYQLSSTQSGSDNAVRRSLHDLSGSPTPTGVGRRRVGLMTATAGRGEGSSGARAALLPGSVVDPVYTEMSSASAVAVEEDYQDDGGVEDEEMEDADEDLY